MKFNQRLQGQCHNTNAKGIVVCKDHAIQHQFQMSNAYSK